MSRKVQLDDVPKENFLEGFEPDYGMIPPDKKQCQCCPNMLAHTAFNLGPPPRPKRCQNKPSFIALELLPGKDGKRGSMSLCEDCAKEIDKSPDMRKRVYLQPIK